MLFRIQADVSLMLSENSCYGLCIVLFVNWIVRYSI